MAGYTVLMASPLVLASVLLWAGRPTVSMASARSSTVSPAGSLADGPDAVARPPVVSLTIEPATLTPYAESEPPVVLPGYLLPDDGGEEPVNAGS